MVEATSDTLKSIPCDPGQLRGRLPIRKDFVGHDGTPLKKGSCDVGHASNSFLIELLVIHMDVYHHWSYNDMMAIYRCLIFLGMREARRRCCMVVVSPCICGIWMWLAIQRANPRGCPGRIATYGKGLSGV